MLMKYCTTIEVVGAIDNDRLMALVSGTVSGATIFLNDGRKTVQVFGQWREVLQAASLAAKIARTTSVPVVYAVAQKEFGAVYNVVSDVSGVLYDVPPYNIISNAEFRDVHAAVMAHKTDVIRLFTEAMPSLKAMATQFNAHVLCGVDDKRKAFGVWQGGIERTAIVDIYGFSRDNFRAARALARKIIAENHQSAVLMAVIRKDGRAYARLVEKGGAA